MSRYLKLVFSLIALTLSSFIYAIGIEDNKGNPSLELLEILEAAHIPHNGTWESILCETQKLLRQPKQELWEIESQQRLTHEKAYTLFKKIEMLEPVSPTRKHYHAVLINGATVPLLRSRLWHVKELWESGITFDQIVFLGGERPLNHIKEPKECLLCCDPYPQCSGWELPEKMPLNEGEAMEYVYNQMDLPDGMRAIPTHFVQAKKPSHHHRPSHKDTLCEWMHSFSPSPKETYLFVSSQPFVELQQAIEKNTLPQGSQFETIGKGISREYFFEYKTAPEICLETLYRWIYEAKSDL
jgi:hypothetical protein